MLLVISMTFALAFSATAQMGHSGYALANAPYSEATDFVDRLGAGSFGRAAENVADSARDSLRAKSLEAFWRDLLERYGPYQGNEILGADIDGDQWRVHVKCSFQKAKVDVVVSFNTIQELGKVTGITSRKLKENELH